MGLYNYFLLLCLELDLLERLDRMSALFINYLIAYYCIDTLSKLIFLVPNHTSKLVDFFYVPFQRKTHGKKSLLTRQFVNYFNIFYIFLCVTLWIPLIYTLVIRSFDVQFEFYSISSIIIITLCNSINLLTLDFVRLNK